VHGFRGQRILEKQNVKFKNEIDENGIGLYCRM
jgi:hypothetical protein